ncbi:MAG: hypothetical protein QW265_01285 [Candidatus Bathyarchaeia archaeon]
MVSEEDRCRFKNFVEIGEKRWEWCFLYNAEVSKLDCDRCGYKPLHEGTKDLKENFCYVQKRA